MGRVSRLDTQKNATRKLLLNRWGHCVTAYACTAVLSTLAHFMINASVHGGHEQRAACFALHAATTATTTATATIPTTQHP
eukprot:4775503-Lingulodinium_polyedra.AAC.1